MKTKLLSIIEAVCLIVLSAILAMLVALVVLVVTGSSEAFFTIGFFGAVVTAMIIGVFDK